MAEAERERYEDLLSEGKAAYSDKNFEEAFEKLKAAHDLHPKSSILFNLGLISEKQGKLERASKYYQKFVEAPDVSLKARQRASERMAAVNEILNASGEGGKTETQKTNLMPALEAMNTEVDEEVSDSGVSEDAEPSASAETDASGGEMEEDDDGGTTEKASGGARKLKYSWPVYASYGAGTVAIASGVYTLAMTYDRTDKAKRAGRSIETREQHLAYEQQATTYATTTAGLFIGGAALVGLGSYFLIRRGTLEKQQSRAGAGDGGRETASNVSVSVGGEYTGVQWSLDF